jgi:pimeloyl-ACP methyl ester carboxylesterase
MKRRELILSTVGLLLLLLGWRVGELHRLPAHELTLGESCRLPVRVIGDSGKPGQPSVIVFHGLGANQGVMEALGQALANAKLKVFTPDLPGHGNNSSPFTPQHAEACAVEAVGALEKNGQIQLDRTAFVGHSMGGALAIRMAEYFPAAATVAISPAPLSDVPGMPEGAILMEKPRRIPVNLLVFVGQFDFPFMKRSARNLVAAAGGERFAEPEDFQQRRAMRLLAIAGATHTSLIYNTTVWDLILNHWLAPSLGLAENHQYFSSLYWGPALGLAGLALCFPLIVSAVASMLRTHPSPIATERPLGSMAVFFWLVAGFLAVSVLYFAVPLRFMKMYSADYLVFCLLIAGVVLCPLIWRMQRPRSGLSKESVWRPTLVGTILGFLVMFAFGAWANRALTDMWLNNARWMRFPIILIACLPLAFAEEWVLGAPEVGSWLVGIRRYLLFFLLRFLIWLSILFAVYVYSSQQILLAVLVLYMGLFSAFVRLGADEVRRRIPSPVGAAIFTTILMAWFIAAVFPLT